MQHERHYSLAEASALLPWVAEVLRRMRAARVKLGDSEARAALAAAGPTNGGGSHGRTVSEGFLRLRDAIGELREREIVLRDLDRGLIDFPALRDGQGIYLCWQEGEDEIGFWHDPESGFSGRRPLDDG
ncbi:MAG TPA: DUF2203 domain-containing protein [Thermoleophilaceae bacterium]